MMLSGRGAGKPARLVSGGLTVVAVVFALTLVAGWAAAPTAGHLHALSLPSQRGAIPPGPTGGFAPQASTALPLQLGIAANPGAVCATSAANCPAGTTLARVTLTAQTPPPVTDWPKVQVLFVLDDTFFNGDFELTDDKGYDNCDGPDTAACESSNGIPVFVAHAGAIAATIQAAHPQSQVTFGLVDYFATGSDYGDGDGYVYNVDVGSFVSAGSFDNAVQSTYQSVVLGGAWACDDCDYWDNFLHSSSIAGLYGSLAGAGLDWASDAHHILLWMGDTAPRVPEYVQNYCVSGWDGGEVGGSCFNQGCEPSHTFTNGVTSPNCEGWTKAVDGNSADSIAAFAHHAPPCVNSLGGSCTIDIIDLWSTATDPYSIGWPSMFSSIGGGAGGKAVVTNVNRVLEAGCALAAATGGSWDGPAWFTCPDGQSGTLQYVPHGTVSRPNTNNPTLVNAFRVSGFGVNVQTQVAAYAGRPIFEFVPFGAIVLASPLEATAACLRNGAPMAGCQPTPTFLHVGTLTYLGWNWSLNASRNVLYAGDVWQAEFNVVATGPPFQAVPVDACILTACKAAGSAPVLGQYTSASYVPYTNASVVTLSFPLAQVVVEPGYPLGTPPAAPAPPPPAPPFPIPVGSPLPMPVTNPVVVLNSSTVGNVSLNATAVGLLAAGLTRASIKNKPIALKMAMKTGAFRSRFEEGEAKTPPGVGRFE